MNILKLKNWQIFLLIYCGPSLIIGPLQFLLQKLSEDAPDNFILWLILFFMAWYIWEYTIGNILSRLIHPEQKFNKVVYKIFYGLKVAITIYIMVTLITLSESDMTPILSVIQLYFIWVGASWYIIYQNAKIIRSAEVNRVVYFSDFFHYFFMLLFLPFGIWLIQSRVNQIVNTKNIA
jgi:hypothetical protein